jgi:hypothetical protein
MKKTKPTQFLKYLMAVFIATVNLNVYASGPSDGLPDFEISRKRIPTMTNPELKKKCELDLEKETFYRKQILFGAVMGLSIINVYLCSKEPISSFYCISLFSITAWVLCVNNYYFSKKITTEENQNKSAFALDDNCN